MGRGAHAHKAGCTAPTTQISNAGMSRSAKLASFKQRVRSNMALFPSQNEAFLAGLNAMPDAEAAAFLDTLSALSPPGRIAESVAVELVRIIPGWWSR